MYYKHIYIIYNYFIIIIIHVDMLVEEKRTPKKPLNNTNYKHKGKERL